MLAKTAHHGSRLLDSHRARYLAALLFTVALSPVSMAAKIYPIDRAEMMAGAHFDFKVEFDQVLKEGDYSVTINGQPYTKLLSADASAAPQWLATEEVTPPAKAGSALKFNHVELNQPGHYQVKVTTTSGESAQVEWTVYKTGKPKAKNVILFIGDGMTVANRTAARILSKGISEGKYLGRLTFDDFPQMAMIGTSGMDAICTDSANSMSAYTTGHKSGVNALGVYLSRAKNNLDHPKVENFAELVKRLTHKSVGVVTDAEIEDATPAGMLAHTRSRKDYSDIIDQYLNSNVDVLMGGGKATFLPADTLPEPPPYGYTRRTDNRNVIAEFVDRGYSEVETASALQQTAENPQTRKMLGLFNNGNLDGALDRHILKQGTVQEFPDQPDLTQMTRDALKVLSRNQDGFVLLVEAGLIDKFSHRLDGERSVYDTIMLSNAVKVAVDWAGQRNDTLIIVTPDHTHPMSLVGDIDENKAADEGREQLMTYAKAKFPTYPAADSDGYPENILATRHLAIVYGAFPDYYESFSPKLDGPNEPTLKDPASPADKPTFMANPKYNTPGRAMLRTGNLPHSESSGVHAVDDGILQATGPGSEEFHGFMDNTQVFHVIVDALGLSEPSAPAAAKAHAAHPPQH